MNLSKVRIRVGIGPNTVDLNAKEAGQILVIFALMLTVLIGLVGMAIDVTYAWRNGLQIQRAADAAAMAGVVYLPGGLEAIDGGRARATAIAAANGYSTTNGSTLVIAANPSDDHQLDVTITAPVPTFFVRLFGINNWTITRQARAAFQLPVPMGSPEAFYGAYCMTTAASPDCPEGTAVPGAASTTVRSHGSFGAIQATGTQHGQGDAFIPLNDPTGSLGTNTAGGTNPDFDPGGYNYAVELPSGGDIYIFDPTACATGAGHGSGDHYNDSAKSSDGKTYSVSTYYKLYNMTDSPLNYLAQPPVGGSGTLFEREYQSDQSSTWGGLGYTLPATSQDGKTLLDCHEGNITDPLKGGYWHDRWWPIGSSLPAGTYRINIRSAAVGAVNALATFENDWSIEATGSGTPHVYGLGKLVTYNIMQNSGVQKFYLAQIGPENAGKTLEIKLFDIGDINGVGTLNILSPDGNVYSKATFSYSSDANCTGTTDNCSRPSATQIKVANNGPHGFDDTWLTIRIKLPATYGSSISDPHLKPAGETQQGWWKVQYNTSSGSNNDTTTWMVSLIGNPVHLVPIP